MTRVARRREKMASLDDLEGWGTVAPDEKSPSIQEMVEENEMVALVSEEINKLPESLKASLLLFYVDDLRYEEMAEVMNVPMGTIKTNLHRGRNLLRQRIQARLKNEVAIP
jgi:RNA polymerase sigma-70 factor (ECF subfamily)